MNLRNGTILDVSKNARGEIVLNNYEEHGPSTFGPGVDTIWLQPDEAGRLIELLQAHINGR
jgi:hypothetical protein